MIDLTKKYRTRDGKAVELFDVNCHDCVGNPAIVGAYLTAAGKRVATTWYAGGKFMLRDGEFCELDLIEDIPVPVQPERLSLTADEIANAFTTAPSTDHALGALGFTMQDAEPTTIEVDFWCNVYAGRIPPCNYETAAEADKTAYSDRVACLHIKRTIKEGDGI